MAVGEEEVEGVGVGVGVGGAGEVEAEVEVGPHIRLHTLYWNITILDFEESMTENMLLYKILLYLVRAHTHVYFF